MKIKIDNSFQLMKLYSGANIVVFFMMFLYSLIGSAAGFGPAVKFSHILLALLIPVAINLFLYCSADRKAYGIVTFGLVLMFLQFFNYFSTLAKDFNTLSPLGLVWSVLACIYISFFAVHAVVLVVKER